MKSASLHVQSISLQGPEHSSARPERFLQMSNDDPDHFPVSCHTNFITVSLKCLVSMRKIHTGSEARHLHRRASCIWSRHTLPRKISLLFWTFMRTVAWALAPAHDVYRLIMYDAETCTAETRILSDAWLSASAKRDDAVTAERGPAQVSNLQLWV